MATVALLLAGCSTDDVGEALRTEFVNNGERLEVSATVIDDASVDQQPTVQYSLVYRQ